MMINGRIFKSGAWWCAEAPSIGVYTQGKTRKEAEEMLADAVQAVIHRDGFAVKVTANGADDVLVAANQPAMLGAYLLKYQRETNGLSLADVAKLLGVSSRTNYARIEQGTSVPTIDKFVEILHAIAPEMAVVIGPRASSPKRKAAR